MLKIDLSSDLILVFILAPAVLVLSLPEQPSEKQVLSVKSNSSRRCRPTCSTPNPTNCTPNQSCKCQTGSVWADDFSKCIPVSECPSNLGCNGDKNATIRANPPPCPSTCDSPNESRCKKLGPDVGCACNPGYILSKTGGVCIKPDECPGGNPCGANETFGYCKSECPNNYCPINDSRGIIACDPAVPCPTGCVCKRLYRRKSYDDPICILGQECPAVECTRPNEEWDSCPSACFTDSCSDAFRDKTVCYTFAIPECYPQCVCKKDFARNADGVCIPKEQCPKESENVEPVDLGASNTE